MTNDDVTTLLGFYKAGRSEGGFDAGIRAGLESILVDPEFLFRIERDPAGTLARRPPTGSAISNWPPGCRSSCGAAFPTTSSSMWPPREAEGSGGSGTASAADAGRFPLEGAGGRISPASGCSCASCRAVGPTPELFPDFDDNLREAFQQETELFVESQLREDRSVLDLLRANYTFVNERLARHYGIPNVYGSRFRRVTFER